MTTRSETMTLRVSKEQKKRIQKLAKKKRISVSTLLLRAIESAESLPPSDKPAKEGETIRIIIGTPKETERAKRTQGKNCFTLDDRAKGYGE